MARTPYVGGNWKMNTDRESGPALAREVGAVASANPGVDVAVFAPFPYLLPVAEATGDALALGAQDCYFEPKGAFTGEVSLGMLQDCRVSAVLTGHSERRHVLGETDELINKKTLGVLESGLTCVLCIGELLEQREAGQTDEVNENQLRAGLAGVSPEQMAHVVVAYEPVWAIGTGKVATPEDAQGAHAKCRAVLADLFGGTVADATRIIYGGSLKPANAVELLAQSDIDGGLVGGASLKASDFGPIIEAAAGQA